MLYVHEQQRLWLTHLLEHVHPDFLQGLELVVEQLLDVLGDLGGNPECSRVNGVPEQISHPSRYHSTGMVVPFYRRRRCQPVLGFLLGSVPCQDYLQLIVPRDVKLLLTCGSDRVFAVIFHMRPALYLVCFTHNI